MSWQEAKAALALAIEGVVATVAEVTLGDVTDVAIARVFTAPPASIEPGELPCVVLGESTLDDRWAAGLATESYELTCSLLLRDEQVERAIEWAEAHREALKNALRKRASIFLEGADGASKGQISNGPSFTALGPIDYAKQVFMGFQFTVEVVLVDTMPDD